MPAHNTLTGSDLHEPKGVDAAAAGQVYIADGSGSGSFERILGWGQYQDSRNTAVSPALTLSSGVRTIIPNDGLGLTLERLPSDATESLWDVNTNKHVAIAEYDTYSTRCVFVAENYSGTSPYLQLELDIGGSIGVINQVTVPLLRDGSAQSIPFIFPVFTGDTYAVNGRTYYITYVGNSTCDIHSVNHLFIRTSREQ